ncbi:hypothetical protein WAI453_009192 [Rhynchosporium graminicola]
MKNQIFASILLLVSSASFGSAWGTLGHNTVAYIATNLVSKATQAYFQTLLNDTSSDYLLHVATWADSYRYTVEGKFSSPFHYMDAIDSPPSSCSVDLARDCGPQGCIVSALSNYTTRIQDETLSQAERAIAAKFIVHFTGDIHQPLHVENLEVGGNGISVLFDNKTTNLHSAWDTAILEQLIGGYTPAIALSWAMTLRKSILHGKYHQAASHEWLTTTSLREPTNTALSWAQDTNKFVCSTVMPMGEAAVKGMELNGTYYDSAIPVVEMQIAKAGYRLAAWLNLIATGNDGHL